jgi:amino acid transporter
MLQDAVAAGGPLLVLAGFLIFPLLWSIPEALITAELATAFPENSGYVAWVTAAFGPFWGFQEGFWSWLSGVTDNSIYPVMFADNLRIFVPALNSGWPRCVGSGHAVVCWLWLKTSSRAPVASELPACIMHMATTDVHGVVPPVKCII